MSIIKGYGMALVISPVKVATPQHRTPRLLRNVGKLGRPWSNSPNRPMPAPAHTTFAFLPRCILLIASQRLFDFPEPEEVCSSDKLVTGLIREVEPVRGFYTPRLIRIS
jgi:hypothetical protein